MSNDRLACVLIWIFAHYWFVNGTTVYEPSFISEWLIAKAQDDHNVEFYVPFTDKENATEAHIPVKVIVEVKVENGSDFYTFNAFGSSPSDDDGPEKYGGVIYFYNASGALIFLPEEFKNDPEGNKDDKGLAVYLDSASAWFQPSSINDKEIKTEYSEASVRVKMWRRSDMPPDYDSDFQFLLRSKIDSLSHLKTYFEIPIGMTSHPDMVVVQAKPNTVFTELPGLISEGSGIPACHHSCGSSAGGLTFAYNASHVRVWVKENYPIISAADGWGRNDYPNSERLVSHEVTVRVLAWTFDSAANKCRWAWNSKTSIDGTSTYVPWMKFPSPQDSVLVLVSISPISGPNGGFLFYGVGSVVTSSGDATAQKRYIGLVYGYNQFGVFVWRVKPTPTSFTFDIDSPWGGGQEMQQTNDVVIDIRVFGLMSRGICNTTDLSLQNGYLNSSFLFPCEREAIVCNYGFQALNGSDTEARCRLNAEWNQSVPECTEVLCPTVTAPPHSEMVIGSRSINGTLTFSCKEGFKHTSGNLTLVCLLDGSWGGDPPTCSEIYCPTPLTFANGAVTPVAATITGSLGVPVNGTVHFSCFEGFRLSSDVILKCLHNGSWSESAPVCLDIFCPNVSDPVNGRIKEANNTVHGSLLYSCDDGFELASGNLSRECTLNGTWSGEPPVCSGERCGPWASCFRVAGNNSVCSVSRGQWPRAIEHAELYLASLLQGKKYSEVITCPALTFPNNADIVVETPSLIGNQFTINTATGTQQMYPIGSKAFYLCIPGFNHTGGNLNRTCLRNGSWSGDSVICTEIFCQPLNVSETFIFVSPTSVSSSTGISVNTTVTFSCHQGYQLYGSSSLTCQIDGTWSGTQPSCLKVCQNPNTPPNSTLVSINTLVNGTAYFACNNGFQHTNGSLQRKCLSSGKWSGDAPICTAIGECMCPCGLVRVPKYTNVNDEKLIQEIKKMQKELTVLKNQTSAALRKKISVKDFRPSANVSGAVWVVLLIVIAGCIVVPDMVKALRHILTHYRQRGRMTH